MTPPELKLTVAPSGVAIVTIDRPQKRNALSLAMWRGLGDLYLSLAANPDIRVVVLTGVGGHFCAGADISEFATVRSTVADGKEYEATGDRATRAIADCPLPTIAAVSGFGVGGGCGIALACDIRVGDATTRMGIPAARLGIVYGTLDCRLLVRAAGLSGAKRVLYTGRFFDAAGSLGLGLLDEVADDALARAWALAEEIAGNAPLSLKGAKAVLETVAAGEEAARESEINGILEAAIASEDYREAARAFVEKRRPVFRGR